MQQLPCPGKQRTGGSIVQIVMTITIDECGNLALINGGATVATQREQAGHGDIKAQSDDLPDLGW